MNAQAEYVLGVDVGGTKILTGFVQQDGTVLCSKRYPMDRSTMESTLASIHQAVDGFLEDTRHRPRPLAAGFGLVGRCDPAAGRWVRAVNLPISKPVDLAAEIRQRYGLPGYIDNDVFSATQAELAWGAGTKYRDFFLMNIGTGLSMGIVTGGKFLRGAGNVAGEVGQLPLLWIQSPTGAPLTLEECCSGGGMIARAKQEMADTGSSLASLSPEGLHAGAIFQAAEQGDCLAAKIAGEAVDVLCWAVSSLVTLLNPGAVVLAGSVACIPGLLEQLESYVRANAYPSSLLDLREIRLSGLDPRTVGLMGAAQVAWQGLQAGL